MTGAQSVRAKRVAQAAAGATLLLLVAVLFRRVVDLNGGRFTYTLDDPYIHLSMSEEIARGGYGVNTGEFAAASSSILYPVLLAPFAGTGFHEMAPLAINVTCLVAFAAVLVEFLWFLGLGALANRPVVVALFAVAAAVSLNVVGVAFSGMEHSLHILLTALSLLGLAGFLRDGRIAWWLVPVLVAGPLVRYEGALISLAAAAVMIARGAVRPGLAAGVAVAGSLAAFSMFLVAHGMAPLPSSVLAKSASAVGGIDGSAHRMLASVVSNLAAALNHRTGAMLVAAAVLAIYLRVIDRRPTPGRRDIDLLMGGFVGATVLGHCMFGAFGWFHRYEIYVLVAVLMSVLFLFRDAVAARTTTARSGLALLAVVATVVAVVGRPYITSTFVEVPIAASNVFEQQHQMHRFVTERWRRPVAANDIGWLSYRNPDAVLDLWGLGSEEARTLRASRSDTGWMAEMVERRHIGLAIVYEDFFGTPLPASWVKVGRIHLGRAPTTVARSAVTFFATDPGEADALRTELREFAPTLPPGVRIDIL